MSQLLKLKLLSDVPHRSIKLACAGVNYKGKADHIDMINRSVNWNHEHKWQICEIDEFNNNNKLMTSHKQVLVKKRAEETIPVIDKYTEPLTLSQVWDSKSIRLVNKLWEASHKNKLFSHPMYHDKSNWAYCNNVQEFTERFYNDKNWICNNDSHVDVSLVKKILEEWRDNVTCYNFSVLLNTVQVFYQYNVTDFSATGVLLTERRNRVADSANRLVESIKETIVTMHHKKKVQKKINDGVSLSTIYPPYDFDKLYYHDKFTARSLKNMHKAAFLVSGGREWITENGHVYSDDAVANKLLYHPLVDADGHSGGTMSCTVGILKQMYTNGWESFVKKLH